MNDRKSQLPRVHREASYDRGVQIAAAQLRVITDRQQGKVTPQWVIDLSNEEESS